MAQFHGGYDGIDKNMYKQIAADAMDVDDADPSQDAFSLDSEGEEHFQDEMEWEDAELAAQAKQEDANLDRDDDSEETQAFHKAEGEDPYGYRMRICCLTFGMERTGLFDPYRQASAPDTSKARRPQAYGPDNEEYHVRNYDMSMNEVKLWALREVTGNWGSQPWHSTWPSGRLNTDDFWLWDASTGQRVDERQPAFIFLKALTARRVQHLNDLDMFAERDALGRRRAVDIMKTREDLLIEDDTDVMVYLILTRAGVQLPQVYTSITIKEDDKYHVLKDKNIWSLSARRVKRHLANAGYQTDDETDPDVLRIQPLNIGYENGDLGRPAPAMQWFQEMFRDAAAKSYAPLPFFGLQDGGVLDIEGDD